MIRRTSLLVTAFSLLLGCSRPAAVESNPPVSSLSSATPAAVPTAPSAAPTVSAASAEPAATLLAVGTEVPDVSALAQDGKTVRLRALKGKPVIVYFYPKDDTTGCTIEAKGIRDQYKDLDSRATVLGVSTDTQDSHKAFADKYSLPFKLLDDSSHTLVTAFGVPVSSGHAKRVTFVIDKDGKVSKVFPNVNPSGHAEELLEALKALG
ncbi:MAG TPA: redoxin domain-containing protein [Polyangiaceae bacterium]|nr:redoxin domain-containing protein [Polyangiaceae bacterium]